MLDHGLLKHLAFKGGTAIRKLHLGNQGRFSLDLDFTAISKIDPETLILEIAGTFHNQSHYGITFSIPAEDYYANPDCCGAEVSYQHDWAKEGRFGIQVSFRAHPFLPLRTSPLVPERYFAWLGIDPPLVPALDLNEIIGEKIRAASQRSRVRDLYDLYQLSSRKFDRDLVCRIAILKCWETNSIFDPQAFFETLGGGRYDWADLRRLIRKGWDIQPETIIRGVRDGYAFLSALTSAEVILAADPYRRQQQVYRDLVVSIQQ